jgi:hypothetical protein
MIWNHLLIIIDGTYTILNHPSSIVFMYMLHGHDRWKQMYGRYGHLPEIVGLSLQRQYLVPGMLSSILPFSIYQFMNDLAQ